MSCGYFASDWYDDFVALQEFEAEVDRMVRDEGAVLIYLPAGFDDAGVS